ncbi:MAG: single-stranded-DNA-specific exonuclease RecJ, partial [Candidatus Omnitrophica bacterium]|nr:single-stranded-DNA-specific exonuclease RecJ [Candidatus Omnitrophota bacterium]
MEKRWRVKKPDERLKAELAKRLGIHPVIAGLLVNRGITAAGEVESFLSSELSGLHSPLLLKDINPAVRRIKEAVEKKEKILIYGDYDADGVTSVALLYTILKKFTPNVIYYIPNRLEEGYDLNKDACGLAKSREVSLIITVDCGITAVDEVDYLNSLGIDIIITDHHQPQSELPKAHSIINPHQPGCEYPFKQLAGVGVAFKLAQALAGEFVDEPLLYLKPHLDLVAMGTIADVVPLLGENRILIKYGLEQLNQTKKTGLTSLIKSARLDEKVISAGHISFILAPRINAAGRIGSAEAALKLLLTGDELEAEALAKLLNDGNRQRQKIQEKTLKEALSLVEKDVNSKEHLVIVLSDDWHPGVVGIVASKLVDKFYRPAIIISTKKEPAKG